MDALTFTSEIIKSVAWPVATVLLALMLRKPVTELIPFLRKLKYKELEMEFSKGVTELKAEAITHEPTASEPPEIRQNAESRLLTLVNFSTRAAIVEAWIELESAATEVASSFWNKPPDDALRHYPKLGEYLLQCQVIDGKQLETFNKLRELRNKAAHVEELDLREKDARSYIELASALAAHIRAK